mmetsp:Transcript_38932/g.59174  ORF Transcript_38932/g.59174 Transcript_38932/m.59174 type:complete len:90 (+) Transcript_38932:662-931(+)
MLGMSLLNSIPFMVGNSLFMNPLNQEVYPVYQGEHLRHTIDRILTVLQTQFFCIMGSFIFVIVVVLIMMCESGVVEMCLPDFKGTYDED